MDSAAGWEKMDDAFCPIANMVLEQREDEVR